MEDEPNLRMLVMKKAAGKFTAWVRFSLLREKKYSAGIL
jgi:hypothetical protein